jgi:uncharacterized RDD family membrane protein YckC
MAQPAVSTPDGIVTPEAVVLELETAGLASRVLSGIIDLALQVVGMLLAAVVIAVVALAIGDVGDSFFRTAYAIAITLILLGYPVVMETIWRGRTLGKMWVGLRAITIDGAPITVRHATLRMMGGLIDKLIPPGGVTGALFILGTRRHQRVGDLLAGTIVIRDPQRLAFPPAVWFPVPVGFEHFAASLDPTPITVEQYTVVRAYLMRVHELQPDVRYSLAVSLADRVAAALHQPRPIGVHPEAYLLCAVARYQRQNFGRR